MWSIDVRPDHRGYPDLLSDAEKEALDRQIDEQIEFNEAKHPKEIIPCVLLEYDERSNTYRRIN